mmetsp:Transcript_6958/g.11096  ORF Transcript_6958/g.11096 Transcript_6958/m.11096 type:complete len:309 (+) Transcript_6958:317-1243(+)
MALNRLSLPLLGVGGLLPLLAGEAAPRSSRPFRSSEWSSSRELWRRSFSRCSFSECAVSKCARRSPWNTPLSRRLARRAWPPPPAAASASAPPPPPPCPVVVLWRVGGGGLGARSLSWKLRLKVDFSRLLSLLNTSEFRRDSCRLANLSLNMFSTTSPLSTMEPPGVDTRSSLRTGMRVNSSGKLHVRSSGSSLGVMGAGRAAARRRSHGTPANSLCACTSAAPRAPSRWAGFFLRMAARKVRKVSETSTSRGSFTGSRQMCRKSRRLSSASSCQGGRPTRSSKARMPSAHQSAACPYPLRMSVSGAR